MHLLRNLAESFYADDKKKEKWLRLASSTRYNDECGTSVLRRYVGVCVCACVEYVCRLRHAPEREARDQR